MAAVPLKLFSVIACGLWAAWLGGCEAEVVQVSAELSLRHPRGCQLDTPGRVQLRATGDFEPWEHDIALSGAPDALPDAPADSRVLVLDGEYGEERAGGLWTLGDDDEVGEVLMLPLGRSCKLGDDSETIAPGAAVVTLEDGAVLAFGGHGPEGAHDRVLMRRRGALDFVALDARLSVPRAWASATRVGSRVLVAGGGPGGDARLIYDSFEVFDLEAEAFVPELRGELALGPRRSHSAVALLDGRVLIVGGVGAGSEAPLSSAELIDPGAGRAVVVDDELSVGRRMPGLWRLRSGIILVAGGEDARGIAVPSAEWLDLERMRFMPTGAALGEHPDAVTAQLPGNRIAWFGCDARGRTCELDILLSNFDVERVPIARSILGGVALGQLRMIALGDNRLQIHGESETDGSIAVQLDLDTGAITPAPIDGGAQQIWSLNDGSVLHHGAGGTFVTRHTLRSPYDAPPDDALDAVTLDGRSRWAVSSMGLSARAPQSRFDLPRLVFGDVDVAVELDGNAELLLTPDGVRAVAIAIEPTRIAVGDCTLSRAVGEPVHVQRRGQQLTIESAGQSDRCPIETLRGPVGLALRAGTGTTVTALRVTR